DPAGGPGSQRVRAALAQDVPVVGGVSYYDGAGMKRGDRELVDGLGDATLETLQDRFPAEWKEVGEALVAAARTKRPEDLAAFMNRFQREEKPWRARIQRARVSPATVTAALPRLAKARMARMAAEAMLG